MSISGIQKTIVALAMNQQEWSIDDGIVKLAATSKTAKTSNNNWMAKYDFMAKYPEPPIGPDIPERTVEDGSYRLVTSLGGEIAAFASASGCVLSHSAGALDFERDAATRLYRISAGGKLLTESASAAVLADADGSASQLWRVSPCKRGYTVTSSSNLAFDDHCASRAEGNLVWLYGPNGSAAQAWRLL